MLAKLLRGGTVLIEGHSLVQLFEHDRMRGLKTHRDLELSADPLGKPEAAVTDQRGMALHDHPLEVLDEHGDTRILLGRDGAWIEEAAAVVELDVACRPEAVERVPNLARDCARGDALRECVTPQVTHGAAPRALAIGEEDRCDLADVTGGEAFAFDQVRVGPLGIDGFAGASAAKDPAITVSAGFGIRDRQECGGHRLHW